MSRDGSGTYSLPQAAFVAGTTIEASKVNSNFSDIASALTASLTKDGQTTATGNQPMGGFKHTNVAVATARTDYARASQVQDHAYGYALTTGDDTIVATLTPSLSAYAVGAVYTLKKNANANTGAVTLNVNGLGAGSVTWPDGTALAAGELPANCMFTVATQAATPVFHLTSVSLAPSKYIAKTYVDAKGDLITASAADTPALLSAGSNGSVLMARSADSKGLAYVAALNKAIYGLTYANSAGDATNDIDIAAGGCMDATGAYWITLSAITKQLDAAWAVGTNAGGLDTGTIANTDYYIWAIARSDTGVTDALFSTSATAPTMPTNYDYKRLIGWFKRSGGTIVAFKTYEMAGGGLSFEWAVPRLDINLATTLTTSRRTDALSVPLNFSVVAHINFNINHGVTPFYAWIYNPDQTDSAPSNTAAPLSNVNYPVSGENIGSLRVRTSATGTIAARASATNITLYAVATVGFDWGRRN